MLIELNIVILIETTQPGISRNGELAAERLNVYFIDPHTDDVFSSGRA